MKYPGVMISTSACAAVACHVVQAALAGSLEPMMLALYVASVIVEVVSILLFAYSAYVLGQARSSHDLIQELTRDTYRVSIDYMPGPRVIRYTLRGPRLTVDADYPLAHDEVTLALPPPRMSKKT